MSLVHSCHKCGKTVEYITRIIHDDLLQSVKANWYFCKNCVGPISAKYSERWNLFAHQIITCVGVCHGFKVEINEEFF